MSPLRLPLRSPTAQPPQSCMETVFSPCTKYNGHPARPGVLHQTWTPWMTNKRAERRSCMVTLFQCYSRLFLCHVESHRLCSCGRSAQQREATCSEEVRVDSRGYGGRIIFDTFFNSLFTLPPEYQAAIHYRYRILKLHSVGRSDSSLHPWNSSFSALAALSRSSARQPWANKEKWAVRPFISRCHEGK